MNRLNTPSFQPKLIRALKWICAVLEAKKIPYQATGGLAASLYGSKRPVNDIDIDIPHDRLPDLLPAVATFITAGPERQKDKTWDVFLVCLDFENQLIDVTTTESPAVNDKNGSGWFPLRMNFSEVTWIEIHGLRLPVQNPADLIEYKSRIGIEEQKHKEDVAAIQSWILRSEC